MKICVTGAGGMIGGHLVKALMDQGHLVRAVDIKPRNKWWQVHFSNDVHNYYRSDCLDPSIAAHVCEGADYVYHLAENMGGIGFITSHVVDCAESLQIGMTMIKAAANAGVKKFLFTSSACVYPLHLQNDAENTQMLQEEDAWPAQPEDGYGLSKLYMEELCNYYRAEGRIDTRIARLHNVFGTHGSWNDGREKAPAALCRKVATAKLEGHDTIEIWGDGTQMRSYLHVNDCVAGLIKLMDSDCHEPVNLGSNRAISVRQMVEVIQSFDKGTLYLNHNLDGATGVAARNADVTKALDVLGWVPQLSLEKGLEELYNWIKLNLEDEKHRNLLQSTSSSKMEKLSPSQFAI